MKTAACPVCSSSFERETDVKARNAVCGHMVSKVDDDHSGIGYQKAVQLLEISESDISDSIDTPSIETGSEIDVDEDVQEDSDDVVDGIPDVDELEPEPTAATDGGGGGVKPLPTPETDAETGGSSTGTDVDEDRVECPNCGCHRIYPVDDLPEFVQEVAVPEDEGAEATIGDFDFVCDRETNIRAGEVEVFSA